MNIIIRILIGYIIWDTIIIEYPSSMILPLYHGTINSILSWSLNVVKSQIMIVVYLKVVKGNDIRLLLYVVDIIIVVKDNITLKKLKG